MDPLKGNAFAGANLRLPKTNDAGASQAVQANQQALFRGVQMPQATPSQGLGGTDRSAAGSVNFASGTPQAQLKGVRNALGDGSENRIRPMSAQKFFYNA